MSNGPVTPRPGQGADEEGLAESSRDPVADRVRPLDGPTDRAGTEAEAEAGMSNRPIPIPNDDPEVGLTTPVED